MSRDVEFITYREGNALLDWLELAAAIEQGHQMSKAEVKDTFIYRKEDTLLSRSAWIDGLGLAVKSATIFPQNSLHSVPKINGAVSLFSDKTGVLEAILDFHLVTKWKTAGDSITAALRLAKPGSKNILIVGAGTVGHSLLDAYSSAFPNASFQVWNRTHERAVSMTSGRSNALAVEDLEASVRSADIISCATMSKQSIIKGKWLRPGQHLDLIGAYRPDMREVDDLSLCRSKIFVDSYDTTIEHIGELKIPLKEKVISRADILADFYHINKFTRESDDEITIFKNGGGAHLDLMVAKYILTAWQKNNSLET
tara:strand:- start:229 stop:1164 length:936 start_codon:yes stop_codon:yes gene_type:complete